MAGLNPLCISNDTSSRLRRYVSVGFCLGIRNRLLFQTLISLSTERVTVTPGKSLGGKVCVLSGYIKGIYSVTRKHINAESLLQSLLPLLCFCFMRYTVSVC